MAGEEDFDVQVGAWCDQVENQGREVFLGIGLAALGRVKELTPVQTGNLRAAWQILPDGEQAPIVGRDPGKADVAAVSRLAGAETVDPAARSVEDVQLGQRLRIVNPTIYARAVEHGREIQRKDGGTTHIPGHGMVAQTVTELPRIADEVVDRLRRANDARG